MALKDQLEQLQSIDFNNLDANNIGMWPLALKVIVLVVAFVLAIGGGYYFYVSGLLEDQDRLVREEQTLRQQFEQKAGQAANLEELKQQRVDMEESFGALLRQLPSDTEVPGLLEDITLTGLDAGLKFQAIDLLPERQAEFYIELPISITVQGLYHNMGTFVSGVANLSRIVTLHNFQITPVSGTDPGGELVMQIEARTYRYLDSGS